MNSLTIKYPWYSTLSKEMAYEYTMKPSAVTSTKLTVNIHTLNTTLGQPQQDPQINLKM